MTTAIEMLSPSITLNGSPISPDLLSNVLSVRIQRSLRLPSRMTIRLLDASFESSLAASFKIGTEISMLLPNDGKLMTGEVTGMSLAMTQGNVPELTVVADDLAYKLGREVKVRTFLNVTWSDVVSKIAQGVGLRANSDATSELNPYLMQADTDLAFLDQIADRIGYDWWVDEKTLYFKKPSSGSPTRLTFGVSGDMTQFSVQGSGLHPTEVKVHGWNPKDQQMITGTATANQAPVKPDSSFARPFLNPVAGLAASAVTVGALSPTTQTEAQTLAKSLAQQWISGSVEARGTCDTKSSLTPGSAVEVSNAGPLSGTYHLTEVEHCWDDDGLRTHFVAGARGRSTLTDTLTANATRTGSFHIPGLLPALVTNNADPDNLGRVKVKFSGISDEVEGSWARVVILGGGADRGVIFEPEVDDEVLVGFEGGDPRKPVVIGGLYSDKKKMPAWAGGTNRAGGKVTSRKIASRSGHQILFSDGDASTDQYILLQHRGSTQKIKLGSEALEVETAAGKPFTVKSGSSQIQIDGQGNIAVKGVKVAIEGEAEVTISAPKVSLNGKAQAQVSGAMVSVKGDSMAEVQSSGILTLKGSMVAIN
jgi:uncharacterized protein involved in type VI secretion and phage assembly